MLLTADGELMTLDTAALRRRVDGPPLLLCHAKAVGRRCGLEVMGAFDLLELFAFARPGRFCAPTPRGLADGARPAGAGEPGGCGDHPAPAGRDAAARPVDPGGRRAQRPGGAGGADGRGRLALGALRGAGAGAARAGRGPPQARRLPGLGPSAGMGGRAAEPAAVAARGRAARGPRPAGPDAGRGRRAAAAAGRLCQRRRRRLRPAAGAGRADRGAGRRPAPAPARPWATWPRPRSGRRRTARRSGCRPTPATCSTRSTARWTGCSRTRSLKARQVVLRKGRENYLCLLNYEDAVRGLALNPRDAVPLGLMARWAAATRDGDLTGGDFPGWLADIIGRPNSIGPGRPARRMHPFRLPALQPLLHRARHPPGAQGADRHRQPRAGDDPGGAGRGGRPRRAQPLRLRRGAPPVRGRRFRLRRAPDRAGGDRPAPLAAGP